MLLRQTAARLLLTLMMLGLVACGRSDPTATAVPQATPTSAPTAPALALHATAVILPTDAPDSSTTAPAATTGRSTTAPTIARTTTAPATGARSTTAPATSARTAAPTMVSGTATPDALLQRPETGATMAGQVMYLSNTGAVYLTKPDGKTPLRLSAEFDQKSDNSPARYLGFPSLSPDGKMVVAGGRGRVGGSDIYGTYVMNTDGSSVAKGLQAISESPQTTPVYALWSPDSASLALLQGDSQTKSVNLSLAQPRGTPVTTTPATVSSSTTRSLATSSAIYSAWSPDSANLVFHTDGAHSSNATAAISQVQARTANAQIQKVSDVPSSFRAPAWSRDGKYFAYGIEARTSPQDTKPDAVVVQPVGGAAEEIGRTGTYATFSWSPTEPTLALSWLGDPQTGFADGIYLGKPGGKGLLDHIVTEEVMGWFWSPDGKKLAYVAYNGAGVAPLAWKVYDIATRKSTAITNFFPSESFLQVLVIFDQYSQSDAVWSPDSQALVFAGWVGADLDSAGQPKDQTAPHIYVTGLTTRPRSLANGELGFWTRK